MLATERTLLRYYRVLMSLLLVLVLVTSASLIHFWSTTQRVNSFRVATFAAEHAVQNNTDTLIAVRRMLSGEPVRLPGLADCRVTGWLATLLQRLGKDPVFGPDVAAAEAQHIRLHGKLSRIVVLFGAGSEPERAASEDYYLKEVLPEFPRLSQRLHTIIEKLDRYLAGEVAAARLLMALLVVLSLVLVLVGVWTLRRVGWVLRHTITTPLLEIMESIKEIPSELAPMGVSGDGIRALREVIGKATRLFLFEHVSNAALNSWAPSTGERSEGATAGVGPSQRLLDLLSGSGLISSGGFYEYDEGSGMLRLEAGVAVPEAAPREVRLGEGLIGEVALKRAPGTAAAPDGSGLPAGSQMVAVPVGPEKLDGVLLCCVSGSDSGPEVAQFFARMGWKLGLVRLNLKRQAENMRLLAEVTAQAERAEGQLAHLRAVFHSSLDGICTINAEGRITSWNRGATEITGYSEPEALGRLCRDVLRHTAPDGSPICGTANCALCRALAGESVKAFETHITSRSGRFVPIKVSAAPVTLEGAPVREVVQVFHDMTELRLHIAQVEEANRAKTEFLATMSHELRTPLNAVIGFGDLLESDAEPGTKQRRYAANIVKAGNHLLSLINDVLDLSKIEAGKLVWEGGRLDLAGLVQSCAALMKDKVSEAGLRLVVDVRPGLLGSAYGDERKLKQIIYNLLSNAVKFTPAGKAVGVGAELSDAWLTITVWDEGIGIPEEMQALVFEPFVQVDSSATRKYPGTGLGLSIVKKLVELGGGHISMTSKPGAGTRITVHFPVQRDGAMVVVGSKAGDSEPEGERSGVTAPPGPDPLSGPCLVVEDDPTAAELLQSYLRNMGYEPAIVPDAPGCFAYLESTTPLFITLDVLLPGISGWEILTRLRETPRWRSIPVIIISVLPETSKGIVLGANRYLVKPVDRGQLYEAVTHVLGDQPAHPAGCARATVLVVDDEPEAVDVIATHLRLAGYDTVSAYSAASGLRLAQEIMPDVIILDLLMPGASGFDFLQQKAGIASLRDLPVIVLTSKHLTASEREQLAKLKVPAYGKASFFEPDFLHQLQQVVKGGNKQ